MQRALAAIVLAAGMGRRMHSARPKVLHEIGGEPMLVRVLKTITELGASPAIAVVGDDSGEIEKTVRRRLKTSALQFAVQKPPRGTGDSARCGVRLIPPVFDGDILVACGDMPRISTATLRRFVENHRRIGSPLSFISARLDQPGSYGRVIRDGYGAVRAITEAGDASVEELRIDEINTGIYLAELSVLRSLLEEIRPDNAQGEYYLTDVVAIARGRGYAVDGWRAGDSGEFAGVNSREELMKMETELRREVNRRLMAAGVTFTDPETAYISPEAEFGIDCVIGPNVQILGRSRFGAGVQIEGTAWLRDVTVGPRAHLKLGVRAEDCRIGEDCEIGPFANLRPGTELEGHNRIGNFVETKKVRIGRGSKASHLSYLGDATIGSDTNIGCGVITVNYDGYDKQMTRIGDRCMIGCDSQLVAPVTIGDDVYVASGSTILREVPGGALAVSRHPQNVKPGWTANWRKRHNDHRPAVNGEVKSGRRG
ncbi:MAG: bifunctional UDP-N-acetylglucosamine diphosphorylase/glucosamine-1-phosphate N-acetyltransferase GlmU [Candidatus Binataceae bacterium]